MSKPGDSLVTEKIVSRRESEVRQEDIYKRERPGKERKTTGDRRERDRKEKKGNQID